METIPVIEYFIIKAERKAGAIMEKNTIELAARYLGMPEAGESLIHKALPLCQWLKENAQIRHAIWIYKIEKKAENNDVYVPDIDLHLPGKLAASMLETCDQVLIVSATLGFAFDARLHQMQITDISAAALFDALGSAWLENSLDDLERKLKVQYAPWHFTDRFSCGYGDLPITLQKELGEKLSLARWPGIIVQDSCMMNPSKSVTAFIGLSKYVQPARIRGCQVCLLKDRCQLRKKGKACYELS